MLKLEPVIIDVDKGTFTLNLETIKQNILITGGSGFIGSALTKYLVENNHNVIVYDNNSRGNLRRLKSVIKKIKFIKGDIRNKKKLFSIKQKIDTVISARIESETETKKDLIDIIKYGQGNLEDEDNKGILGMKGGPSSDSTLIYLGLGSIIFFMLLLLVFKKNKQEVVYLKPKLDAKKKPKKNEVIEKENIPETVEAKVEDVSAVQKPPINPFATMAFEDENVIRAELKALRQSAVSMSVNQREGATQIVKDWLSDGGTESEAEGDEG